MEIPFDLQWELNDEWNKNIAIIPPSIARIIGIISLKRWWKIAINLALQLKKHSEMAVDLEDKSAAFFVAMLIFQFDTLFIQKYN